MFYLYTLLVFILGLIVGSFLNVVILRGGIGRGKRSRSMCLSCAHQLSARDLLPVASFIALKGRCRYCKAKISWQYLIVEVLTGGLFVLSFLNVYDIQPVGLAIFEGITIVAASAILVVIFFYDLRHKIINNLPVMLLSGVLIFRILIIDIGYFDSTTLLFDLLAGPLAALPFFFIWLISGGRWMGLGDAKLMLPLGWLVGYAFWLPTVVLGFWLGAAFVLIVYVIKIVGQGANWNYSRKLIKFGFKTELPFGPFLIASALISLFFNFDVLSAVSGFLM
ncbi:MAG TPA: prepilin peptidase [Candidatus Paceibacterota bacterium]